jgi:hypothetical protein
MFTDRQFRNNLRRKSVSQNDVRQLNKLHMTHGDPLGLKKDELMKFMLDSNYRSRENTLEALKKKSIIVTRSLSYCNCIRPVKMSSSINDKTDLCVLCGGRMPVGGKIKREISDAYSSYTYSSSFLPSIDDEPRKPCRIPNKGKGRTLPLSEEYAKKPLKLPKIFNIDPNRYQKAYLKALHVAKFSQNIPTSWNEYFNHEITPAFIFSYMTHTPRCLNTPLSCRHKKRDDHKVLTSQQIHSHIFKNVKVDDYLDVVKDQNSL